MTKNKGIAILTDIITPIVGEYLAKRAAVRLYEILNGVDQEATRALLTKVVVSARGE